MSFETKRGKWLRFRLGEVLTSSGKGMLVGWLSTKSAARQIEPTMTKITEMHLSLATVLPELFSSHRRKAAGMTPRDGDKLGL